MGRRTVVHEATRSANARSEQNYLDITVNLEHELVLRDVIALSAQQVTTRSLREFCCAAWRLRVPSAACAYL